MQAKSIFPGRVHKTEIMQTDHSLPLRSLQLMNILDVLIYFHVFLPFLHWKITLFHPFCLTKPSERDPL